MKIFVVKGNTGEYDSYRKWDVCAYLSKEKAKKRIDFLNNFLKKYKAHKEKYSLNFNWNKINKVKNLIQNHEKGDENCSINYGGTSYKYDELELIED